jgi:HlyD family secretion protein
VRQARWTIVSLVVVFAVGLGYVQLPSDGGHVVVAEVPGQPPSPDDDPEVLFSSPGVTEPSSRTVQILSEASGTIRAIHVTAGDRVTRGQPLIELSNDIQKAGISLAEAALERAKAERTRLRNWERPEERAIAKAQFDEADASLRTAAFEWQRIEGMTRQNAASEKEVDGARNARALAQARRDAAKKRWELSEAGPRHEDLLRAEAVVREAEAQLVVARCTFEKTNIRSPIDGIVIYRYREPGETVVTDVPSPILTVGDRSSLHVRVDVDETDIAHIWLGQAIYATAPAYGDRRFSGHVVHIEPTLGRKNFRTNRPTEKMDTKVQEVVVVLDQADEAPLELQMVVWFLKKSEPGRAAVTEGPGSHAGGRPIGSENGRTTDRGIGVNR